MKIKKGDTVSIISGKDRGKQGAVLSVNRGRIVVSGVNMVKRHQRVRGGAGSIIEKPMSIDASNAMLVDPKTGKPTRVRISRKDGTRTRVAKSGVEV